jgi:TolA-binding protein
VGQESVRLEREYIKSLREIIKKYPMTKAAKEAKELLDKTDR